MKRFAYSSRQGFTLTEVTISIILFSIVAVSSFELVSWGVHANALGANTTEAMNVAQDKMDELLALGLDGITAGTDGLGRFTRTWAANDQGMPEAVRVSVSWTDVNGNAHAISIRNIAQ